ncbi:hypothetical protein LVJ94_37075 [Pendulispora rubella]|uniref:Uncharacterized protein n=1 Tax=Pendulispora rubella TaxID=2741070 RepID=A0ABZ2L1P4_9BACT
MLRAHLANHPMAGFRFPLLFPLLLAVSAGLGALTPSFSIEPLPPASQEPPRGGNGDKSDPPPADDGATAPV